MTRPANHPVVRNRPVVASTGATSPPERRDALKTGGDRDLAWPPASEPAEDSRATPTIWRYTIEREGVSLARVSLVHSGFSVDPSACLTGMAYGYGSRFPRRRGMAVCSRRFSGMLSSSPILA